MRTEPANPQGEEALVFRSAAREVRLNGQGLVSFAEVVLPLLDGRRTIDEIAARVADRFPREALEYGLGLLAERGLLDDAAADPLPAEQRERLAPQLNLLRESGLPAEAVQARLAAATVSVVGVGGPGATAALALAAAGVGSIRCVDHEPVSAADAYLAPAFAGVAPGAPRAQILAKRLEALNPDVRVARVTAPLDDDAAVLAAVEGSDFVVAGLDPGLASLLYKLNRVCLRAGIPWTSGVATAYEGLVGPTIRPGETACYLCYRMRAVACADDPEAAFAHERFLDARRRDSSAARENLVFGAGVVGHLLALEAFKSLTGALDPATLGHLLVVDLLHLTATRHTVLRKPWCPACFRSAEG